MNSPHLLQTLQGLPADLGMPAELFAYHSQPYEA